MKTKITFVQLCKADDHFWGGVNRDLTGSHNYSHNYSHITVASAKRLAKVINSYTRPYVFVSTQGTLMIDGVVKQ